MIAVTGATGQLGRLVIDALSKKVAADKIVATVRTPAKAADIAALGVNVREADYNKPETLADAFAGVEKLLLISGSEVGQREPQHRAVIEAARSAGVTFIAYTSLLHADTSPLSLGIEHRATEAMLAASGVPMPCCATAGTRKTMQRASHLLWHIMRSLVRRAKGEFRLLHVRTMPMRRLK